jgi:rubrerythrin
MKRLDEEPRARPRDLPELMSLALAMEEEAVRRYTRLAADMEKVGELGLAATFLALIEEERDHVAEITRWSGELTGAPPAAASRPWTLPPEIARSWNEAAASMRLTPYGALSIAVHNEERGFAFYSYIAANSDDGAVRTMAERLAGEELQHAAILRRERRRAYRRERQTRSLDLAFAIAVASLPDFIRQSRRMEAIAAVRHGRIAERLGTLMEPQAAEVIAQVAESERRQGASGGEKTPIAGVGDPLPDGATAPVLLRAALAEAERLHDAYLDLADRTRDEQVLVAAQAAATRTMRNLGSIATQLHASSL